MNFWKSKNVDNLIDVRYEDLVNNKNYEIKRIIKHCELEWKRIV